MRESISIVIPFFNEIDYLPRTVAKTQDVLEAMMADYEIILVDDASFDGSEKMAEELMRQNPRVRVFRQTKTRGLGAAVKRGYDNASKDIIVYTDMDMPFDLSILQSTLGYLDGAEVIHGYRIGRRETILRPIYSCAYNLLIRAVFGYKTKDINFAMTIFRREVLHKITLRAQGSFFSAEFLLKCYYHGCEIVHVPVVFCPRKYGRSRLAAPNHIFKICYELIKYYPEIRVLRQINCRANGHGTRQKIFNG